MFSCPCQIHYLALFTGGRMGKPSRATIHCVPRRIREMSRQGSRRRASAATVGGTERRRSVGGRGRRRREGKGCHSCLRDGERPPGPPSGWVVESQGRRRRRRYRLVVSTRFGLIYRMQILDLRFLGRGVIGGANGTVSGPTH
jgi:hypothetical protein